ncbi:MAG: hypothetical protein Q7J08_03910 [Methanocorpusculum sp.]|uniref:hypothetical protein n=1 Tax=Methanocorpusculum sp. TaxID=2058474 RepID=UPI002721A020|nr:hypothetical protein [Methanocorpusculum sp.]MDO9522841.1 hypothetical protein [Methanocorpusculum sp.]
MTTETRIKTLSVADDTALRSLEISLGKSKITTPSKSLGADLVSPKLSFPNAGNQLNEIYKSFTSEIMNKIQTDQKYNETKNKEFGKLFNNGSNSPTITLLDFKERNTENPLIPTAKEIDTLTNFAYTFSDITPIPALPNYASKLTIDNQEEFLNYLTSAVTSIEEWNHKPIMGYIPLTVGPILNNIVDLYVEHGINAYYIDFNRKGPLSNPTALTTIKRRLGKHGLEENHFLHFVNMDYGKTNREAIYLPARDFLGFGSGLDSMGNAHRPRVFVRPTNGTTPIIVPKKFRVFDKEEYGYYRLEVESLHDTSHFPESALFSRDEILAEPVKITKEKKMGLVNLQEQTAECQHLQLVAAEEVKNSFGYFKSKPCLEEKDLKQIKLTHSR